MSIHYAIINNGSLNTIKCLLKLDPVAAKTFVWSTNKKLSYNLLHLAVMYYPDAQLIPILLSCGFDKNQTPSCIHFDAVAATANAETNCSGLTPLNIAISLKKSDFIQALRGQSSGSGNVFYHKNRTNFEKLFHAQSSL
jgi:hypothetical protein